MFGLLMKRNPDYERYQRETAILRQEIKRRQDLLEKRDRDYNKLWFKKVKEFLYPNLPVPVSNAVYDKLLNVVSPGAINPEDWVKQTLQELKEIGEI